MTYGEAQTKIETAIAQMLDGVSARCRIRKGRVVIELTQDSMGAILPTAERIMAALEADGWRCKRSRAVETYGQWSSLPRGRAVNIAVRPAPVMAVAS
jgi:hypothetical protein